MEKAAPQGAIPTEFDVLVVGCGAAGLYSALCLPEELRVGLLTKETLSRSASDWAQGGMAATVAPDDSTGLHYVDTLRAGAGLCDGAAVKFLVEEAPACVASLVELGVGFDRHGADLAVTLEAAHSRRRVLHAADATGRAVVSALVNRVLERPNITVLQQALVLDLWRSRSGACGGACCLVGDRLVWLRAGATILATGGGGQVFSQTTNPQVSTGDGVAIAFRAGARLRDLEFVQFHPTALTVPGAPRFLISEAVRGEGARLIDGAGRRFALDYHPAGELAPRDAVSRAIFDHLEAQAAVDPHAPRQVWLDLREIEPERIWRRFPNIVQTCRHWGVDPLTEPIPVSPAAHYWMGGVQTDLGNETSVPGLYGVGETASTGVHGANRLASNSLLECIVFGRQFRRLRLPEGWETGRDADKGTGVGRWGMPTDGGKSRAIAEEIRQALPPLVWHGAGICRDGPELDRAIAQVEGWRSLYENLPLSRAVAALEPGTNHGDLTAIEVATLRQWSETRNLLDVAHLILRSARYRTESRGGHFRRDFPTTDPTWTVHTLVQGDRWWTDGAGIAPVESEVPETPSVKG
ncbi:MAG: L-aspartate oxidase [Cyanobacteria bacterium]|nr:L-aspartate oxidase [Cyanobacteriota bacterium]